MGKLQQQVKKAFCSDIVRINCYSDQKKSFEIRGCTLRSLRSFFSQSRPEQFWKQSTNSTFFSSVENASNEKLNVFVRRFL